MQDKENSIMAHFHVCIYKQFLGYTWCNGYTVDAADLDTVRTNIALFVDFEKAIHLLGVTFVSARISAAPDPSHQEFVTVPLSGHGALSTAAENYPAPENTVFIKMNTAMGRPGKKMYRYCANDTQFMGTGANVTITDAAFIALVEAAFTTFLTALSTATIKLVVGALFREVLAGVVAGISNVDTHHGWFNRGNGGPA